MFLRVLTAAGFIVAGAFHFIRPDDYIRIVPEELPAPAALVAISGVAEILGGLGLLVPRTCRVAGLGLVALLVAVFPANVNMAIHHEELGGGTPPWVLWARLPLQAALVGLVVVVSRRDPSRDRSGTR